MTTTADLKDRVLGCVLGGAVGDALGAPFEGMWSRHIPEESELLAAYAEFIGYPRGQYTDDTQLTIATLQAIVRIRRIDPEQIARSIARLWRTQAVVGPGGACTLAADRLLAGGAWQECGAPIGQAGNGTAMRTAALGFAFLNDTAKLAVVVADISRITHQDSRSIAGGVAVAAAARLFAVQPESDAKQLCQEVARMIWPLHPQFADFVGQLHTYLERDERTALEFIAWSGSGRPEFDEPIITPFVIPTVLAALWATMKYPDSWARAVASVIRLGGDVDTLGAIVGALMGAKLGRSAIPEHLASTVLDADNLESLALKYWNVIKGQFDRQ